MKKIILILCILMLGMPSMAQTIKIHVNEQPSQQNQIKLGGGFTGGKLYTTVKVNNKQILRLNSKKLTSGMLSFANIRF